jgi:hypothetical protein
VWSKRITETDCRGLKAVEMTSGRKDMNSIAAVQRFVAYDRKAVLIGVVVWMGSEKESG